MSRGLDDLPDEELVELWSSDRSSEAFEVLLRRHQDRVYGLAFRLTGNRPDALDATQETFLRLMRKSRSFEGRSAFTTWLYRLASNVTTDLLRKKGRGALPVEVHEIAGEDESRQVTDQIAARQALARLPDEQRTVLVLRDLLGLSYAEIAESLEVAEGTVKSRIARARDAMARMFEEPQAPETRLKERDR